jgi:uncharacterized protein YndB with AHSA1/START domain
MAAKRAVHLHCVLTAKTDKIYRAFLDPDALARWLPPNGLTGKVHHLDAKVSAGTELNMVQEGLPKVLTLEACYLGWQESPRNLAQLVEPEIPD